VTECFFCRFLDGEESDHNRLEDVVLRTPRTTAFISPRAWPGNAGNVIVVPNEHIPDLESADDALIGELFTAAKRIASRFGRRTGARPLLCGNITAPRRVRRSSICMSTCSRATKAIDSTSEAASTDSLHPRSARDTHSASDRRSGP
jgi:galactose-1-phosphate uridylyltransferase